MSVGAGATVDVGVGVGAGVRGGLCVSLRAGVIHQQPVVRVVSMW